MKHKTKVLVLFYSLSGKTAQLAKFIAEGVGSVDDTQVEIKRVPELLPDDFFNSNPHLKEVKDQLEADYETASLDDFVNADGIAIGTPTRFGNFSSQVKHFIDQMTPAWLGNKLVNKPVSVFCSAGMTHGGEELTLVSLMIPLLNLGMIPVGIPYPIQGESPDFDSGSPYGAIYVSGNDRELSEGDKKVAKILGRRLAAMTHIQKCDCEVCQSCRAIMNKLE